MTELKYLNDIYQQASPELKAHPAFLSKLKDADNYVSVVMTAEGYKYGDYQCRENNGKIEIDIFASYLPENRSLEEGGRDVIMFGFELNEKGEFVVNKDSAVSKTNNSLSSKLSMDLNREVIAKDSKDVISRTNLSTFNDLPGLVGIDTHPKGQVQSINDFKYTDQKLRNAVAMIKENPKAYCRGYEVCNITRNSNDPKKAFVTENVYHHNYYQGETTIYTEEMPLTGPNYEVMRVDHIDRIISAEQLELMIKNGARGRK